MGFTATRFGGSGGGGATNALALPVVTAATNSTAGVQGVVPAPPAGSNTNKFLRGDATFATVTVPNVVGATSSVAGTAGLVPAPAAYSSNVNQFLRVDGTFATPTGTGSGAGTMTGATSGSAGVGGLTPNPPAGSNANSFLRGDGTFAVPTLPAVPSLTLSVNQTAHGFSAGQVLYNSGSAYALAKANSSVTLEAVGFVSSVTDANNFILMFAGSLTTGLSTLTPGAVYYLSDSVAGGITSTAPTASTSFIRPLLIALTSTTGIIQIQSFGYQSNGGLSYVQAGTVIDYAGTISPPGYLLCNGQAVSRATYSVLYGVIGTIWGVGDGSTTFNVPNLARYTTIGSGGTSTSPVGPNTSVGSQGGEETHLMAATELVAHNHNVTTKPNAGGGAGIAQASSGTTYTTTTAAAGGGVPFNVMQLSAVVTKCIKY